MAKILVTGANGQLGREIRAIAASYPNHQFIFVSKSELPIQDANQVLEFFTSVKPDYCVNCAAYTAVDKAETERDQAFLINATGVANLATACRGNGVKFIHVSTDYVFDGNTSRPLTESDPTDPINTYGLSKLKGEEEAMRINPSTVVLRTAWLYSSYGNNFVKTMIRLMGERNELKVIDDQIGSPTYAADLALAVMQIINSTEFKAGIYNYSNEGRISWYQFAVAIREFIGSSCSITAIPSVQYPTPARRPNFSLLDKSKIKASYAVAVPEWKGRLAVCIQAIKENRV